ncbi:hypothetical protein NQZ68_032687 [Dissostichus eleginoides]|nr:hypothetical protein NQZ68_032687 [Dissostichus eleginoides]
MATEESWKESSVRRLIKLLKLNETWHELAGGPMRDDSADSSQEKHLVDPPPPSSSSLSTTRPHATGPGVFPASLMSRGSHQIC